MGDPILIHGNFSEHYKGTLSYNYGGLYKIQQLIDVHCMDTNPPSF